MVSVIIPFYNTEEYVGQCIDSVLASSYEDFELLLINDGSTDCSLAICEKYKEKDSRIKIINQKHMGVSVARNRGLQESRGEWVVFVDSDDLLSPDFLVAAAQKKYERYDWMLFDFVRPKQRKSMSFTDRYYGVADRESLAGRLLCMRQLVKGGNTSLCSPCAKIYKKSVIERRMLRFPEDIAIGEDRLFNLKFLMEMKSCVYIRRPVYFVRRRTGSLTRGFRRDCLYDNEKYQRQLLSILEKEHLLPLLEKEYKSSVLTDMADVLIWGIFNPHSTRTCAEEFRLCRKMQKNKEYRQAMRYCLRLGRPSRRLLLFFFSIKRFRIVKLFCRMSFRVLSGKDKLLKLRSASGLLQ